MTARQYSLLKSDMDQSKSILSVSSRFFDDESYWLEGKSEMFDDLRKKFYGNNPPGGLRALPGIIEESKENIDCSIPTSRKDSWRSLATSSTYDRCPVLQSTQVTTPLVSNAYFNNMVDGSTCICNNSRRSRPVLSERPRQQIFHSTPKESRYVPQPKISISPIFEDECACGQSEQYRPQFEAELSEIPVNTSQKYQPRCSLGAIRRSSYVPVLPNDHREQKARKSEFRNRRSSETTDEQDCRPTSMWRDRYLMPGRHGDRDCLSGSGRTISEVIPDIESDDSGVSMTVSRKKFEITTGKSQITVTEQKWKIKQMPGRSSSRIPTRRTSQLSPISDFDQKNNMKGKGDLFELE